QRCLSSRRRHTSFSRDWSSDVCSSDLLAAGRREGRRDVILAPFGRRHAQNQHVFGQPAVAVVLGGIAAHGRRNAQREALLAEQEIGRASCGEGWRWWWGGSSWWRRQSR